MRRANVVAGLVALGLCACRADHAGLVPRQPPSLPNHAQVSAQTEGAVAIGSPLSSRRHTSPTEDSLINALVAHYPGARGDLMRSVLYNPQARLLPIDSAPPDVQRLETQISAIRQARADSIALAQHARAPYPATVALVLKLPTADTSATAVILRRVKGEPHDLVLLPAGRGSVGAYAAAIRELAVIRSRDGDLPTRDEGIVVHGATMPGDWTRSGFDKIASSDFDRLQAAVPRRIGGIGTVPALTIQIAPMHRHP